MDAAAALGHLGMIRLTWRVLAWLLAYLVLGYLVNVGIFLASNPGYLRPRPSYVARLKCPLGPAALMAKMIATPHFWFGVLIWPAALVTYLGAR